MLIELSTDNHIHGTDQLKERVSEWLERPLARFDRRITRLEVHLADENGQKKGSDDKRCMLEARLEKRQPTTATHHADSIEAAVRGAAQKLERVLDHQIGKLESRG